MISDGGAVTDGRDRRPLPRWIVEAPLPDDPEGFAAAVRQLRAWAATHSYAWTEIVSARRLHAERARNTAGGDPA